MTVTPSNSSAPNLTEIVKNRLYLGNLSAALSAEEKQKWTVSHIVSVCPDYPSMDPNHLNISIDDTEYNDLLISLPEACAFIQNALDQGGRMLVHCVMGISRSSMVVAVFSVMAAASPGCSTGRQSSIVSLEQVFAVLADQLVEFALLPYNLSLHTMF